MSEPPDALIDNLSVFKVFCEYTSLPPLAGNEKIFYFFFSCLKRFIVYIHFDALTFKQSAPADVVFIPDAQVILRFFNDSRFSVDQHARALTLMFSELLCVR